MAEDQAPSQSIPVLRATIPVDLDLSAAEKKLDAFEDRLNAIGDRIQSMGSSSVEQPDTSHGATGLKDSLLNDPRHTATTPGLSEAQGVRELRGDAPMGVAGMSRLSDILEKENSRQILQVLQRIDQKLDQILMKEMDG